MRGIATHVPQGEQRAIEEEQYAEGHEARAEGGERHADFCSDGESTRQEKGSGTHFADL